MITHKLLAASVAVLFLSTANFASASIRKCAFDSCVDDVQIAANVQKLLDNHASLGPPNSIQVQSFDHVVYLHGVVDTAFDKWIAESVASQAPNVARVVNSIEENN